MLKWINRIINIVMGSFLGVFLGNGIYVYWDFRTHPKIYEAWSAPWYTGIMFYGIFTALVLAVCLMLKLVMHVMMKKEQKI